MNRQMLRYNCQNSALNSSSVCDVDGSTKKRRFYKISKFSNMSREEIEEEHFPFSQSMIPFWVLTFFFQRSRWVTGSSTSASQQHQKRSVFSVGTKYGTTFNMASGGTLRFHDLNIRASRIFGFATRRTSMRCQCRCSFAWKTFSLWHMCHAPEKVSLRWWWLGWLHKVHMLRQDQ